MAGDEDARKDEFSLGPFASECGIMASDLTKPVAGKLTSIKYGLVLEIIDNIPSHSSKEAADILIRLAHQDSPIHQSNPDSLRQKIASAVTTRGRKKRNSKKTLLDFLKKEFVPPVTSAPRQPATTVTKRTYEELKAENDEIKQELSLIEEEQKHLEDELHSVVQLSQRLSDELAEVVINHKTAITTHTKDIKKLKREKTRLQHAYELKSNELDNINVKVNTLKQKSSAKSEKIKYLKKKVKRDTECNEKRLKEMHDLNESNKVMQEQMVQKDECLQVATEKMESAVKGRCTALKDLGQVKRRAKKI